MYLAWPNTLQSSAAASERWIALYAIARSTPISIVQNPYVSDCSGVVAAFDQLPGAATNPRRLWSGAWRQDVAACADIGSDPEYIVCLKTKAHRKEEEAIASGDVADFL